MRDLVWKLWLPATAMLLWEGASRAGWLEPLFFPAPSTIIETLIRLLREGVLGAHLLATLQRIACGFLAGVLGGMLCAVLAALLPGFARSVEPSLAALYSVPKLTLLPLFILVLGTGARPRIVVVALGVFLLIAVQTLDAIRSVSPDMLEMARNYGARGWSLFGHVYWPASLPRLLTALRVAAGRATVLTISTEILGSSDGIGSLIWFGWQTFATERIYVGVLISALLGASLLAVFRRMERRFVLWMSLLMVMAAGAGRAQTFGIIEGRVLDPSGAGVAGTGIRVRETASGAVRAAISGVDGSYRTPSLPPGEYEVDLAPAGFQPLVRTGIILAAGRAVWVDLRLSLSASKESITVSEQPALVNTNASDWGGSQDQQRLESLPLNGRDLFSLAAQQTGANLNATQASSITNGLGLALSVNGARSNQNSFRLDGIYINDASHSVPGSASGRLLGLENVQELRLVTSPFSAEYGQTAGGVLTAVSKSGTNTWHGSAYEFARNSRLDARNFFDLEEAPPLSRHQFGGLLSGPLRQDRFFFMANYEGLRDTTSRTVRAVTLTEAARQGNLPGLLRISVPSDVRPFLDVYPLPNGAAFGDGTAELAAERTRDTTENYAAGKLDWIPNDRLRVSGRYTWDGAVSAAPDELANWRLDSRSRFHFVQGDAQWILSPRTMATTRAGFSRILNGEYSAALNQRVRSLSFIPGEELGSIRVTGLTDIGGTLVRQRPRENLLNDLQVQQDVTRMSGRHTLQAGAGWDLVRFNQIGEINKAGYYLFNSVASLLQGRPTSVDVMAPGSDASRRWRQSIFSAFAQDEYRLGPRFSLTLGVRWEAYTSPVELDGKMATIRNPFADKTITVGGPLFRNPSWDNLAPRVALAWDPFGGGRTVIRAGFGVFFDLLGTRELVVAGVRVPPFFMRLVVNAPIFPNLPANYGGAPVDPSVDMVDYQVNQPYTLQQQLEIQHQLAGRTVLRVGYAGSRGVHLPGQLADFNVRVPQRLSDGRLYFPAGAPRVNPNFERIGTRRTQFNSFFHALHTAVEHRFGRGFGAQLKYSWAKSIDEHSVSIFTEFDSQRYMPMVFDYRANRGRSNFDLRHAAAANFTASTRRFSGWELHGIVTLQSGFPFTPTVGFDRAQLGAATDLSQRPDYIGAPGVPVILGTADRWFDPNVFGLPAAGFYGNLGRNNFSGPRQATFDGAVHKTLWRRERNQVNLRVEVFNLANRTNLQIPSSLALFDNRGQRVGSAGRSTQTATSSRQIQMALRWSF